MLLDQVGVVGKATSSSGVLVVGLGGSGTVSGSTRGRHGVSGSGGAVTVKAGTVLAGKSDELVTLGALGNLDAVLVSPLLDLAV